MTTITGELASYLELLGASKDDERVLTLVQSTPHFREGEPFDDPGRGGIWVDVKSASDGINLQFLNGFLNRVVIHAQAEAYYDAYPRPTELLAGLDISTATRDDLIAALGEPWKSSKEWCKHKLGKQYLHTAFRHEKCFRIVVMSTPR